MAVVDSPELSPKSLYFLDHLVSAFVVARIEHNRADIKAEPFVLSAYLRIVSDSKLWAFAALYMFPTTNSNAAYLLPINLRVGMGFSV